MENFEADTTLHPSQYLYPDDPYKTCRDESPIEKGVCTFYFPRYFLRIHPNAYDQLHTFCIELTDETSDACIKGMGSAAMKQWILNPTKAIDICSMVSPAQRSYCIEGLLSYMIVHYATTKPAKELCDSTLRPNWDSVCTRMLKQGADAYLENE